MSKKTNKIKALRVSSGLNQKNFWRAFGVTQSGGSRYESGRSLPKPTKILMRIALGMKSEVNVIVDGLRGVCEGARRRAK